MLFPDGSLERVFGAQARLGEVAIGAILHRVGIAVPELVGHGVVAALRAVVRLFGAFSPVSVIEKMIAFLFGIQGLSGIRQ